VLRYSTLLGAVSMYWYFYLSVCLSIVISLHWLQSVCPSVCLSVCQRAAVRRAEMNRTPRVKRLNNSVLPAAGDDVDSHKKIDWHDYTQIARDEQRTGIIFTCHS